MNKTLIKFNTKLLKTPWLPLTKSPNNIAQMNFTRVEISAHKTACDIPRLDSEPPVRDCNVCIHFMR